MIVPLFSTHYQTNTCIHTIVSFFPALFPLTLPFLSCSASPGCMCQWHTVVLCGGPTSGTAVSHKSASSFNRYWQDLSLCVWICATYCIFIFLKAHPHLWITPSPLLHQTLLFQAPSFLYFDPFLSECSTFTERFCVLSLRQDAHGEVSTFPSIACLQLTLCNIIDAFNNTSLPALKSFFKVEFEVITFCRLDYTCRN